MPIQFRIHENDVISKTVLKQKRRFKVFKILARYLRDEKYPSSLIKWFIGPAKYTNFCIQLGTGRLRAMSLENRDCA